MQKKQNIKSDNYILKQYKKFEIKGEKYEKKKTATIKHTTNH